MKREAVANYRNGPRNKLIFVADMLQFLVGETALHQETRGAHPRSKRKALVALETSNRSPARWLRFAMLLS
jgi:hypothetical protein